MMDSLNKSWCETISHCSSFPPNFLPYILVNLSQNRDSGFYSSSFLLNNYEPLVFDLTFYHQSFLTVYIYQCAM